jgi:hypothetical protein
MTPSERVALIMNEAVGSDLNSFEKFEFLPSIKSRAILSEKQERVLRQIEIKIFGENHEQ